MYAFMGISNVLQHAKVTDFFDAYEDLFEMLSAPFFIMFLASVTTEREIRRRRAGEQALRESEEQYRLLVNNIPTVVWMSDRDGGTSFISPKVQEVYGNSPEEISASGSELWFGRIHPEDLEGVKGAYEGLFAGEGEFEAEYRIRHRDGREYAFGAFSDVTGLKTAEASLRESELRHRVLLDAFEVAAAMDGGENVLEIRLAESGAGEFTGVVRDITERKGAEEVLSEARRNLEIQYEELKKLDQMKEGLIRDVSRELKTPVAKHAMQLEILKPIIEKHSLSEVAGDALHIMENSIRRQEVVITNLLDLSRLESGGRKYKKQEVDLPGLIDEVMKDCMYFIDQYGVDVPAVQVQSDEEVRMAFDRFYQSRTASEGSGVGLTICRMIAEGLGGSIAIESEGKSRGTVATVTLPVR